jgi:membrane protein YdbS with pleckstrin-like domain
VKSEVGVLRISGGNPSAGYAAQQDGEKIMLDLRRHWSRLVAQVMVSTSPLLLLTQAIGAPAEQSGGHGRPPAVLYSLIVTGLWILVLWLMWISVRITLTERSLIISSGIAVRVKRVIALETVQAVTNRQSVLGRVLRYGTVEVELLGSDAPERFSPMANPDRICHDILFQKSALLRLRNEHV